MDAALSKESANVIDHLMSAQQEIEKFDDKTKVIYALSSLSACFAVDSVTLVNHCTEAGYKTLMRSYCVGLIKCYV